MKLFTFSTKKSCSSFIFYRFTSSFLPSFLLLFLFVVSPLSATTEEAGFCSAQEQEEESAGCGNNIKEGVLEMTTLGGLADSASAQNSVEIDSLARFAIDEHNKKENVLLELARVVNAQEQVVAGTLHHLTLEVVDAGKNKLYEAKIWVKPWLNFKELQEFRHVGDADDAPSFTSSDLGVKQDVQESGWKSVPVHDPVVKDAANHAVTTIQQRSNSLFPYVLQEIVHAKAEVIEEFAKLEMLLKVKRGEKEEKFKVEVHKKNDGSFHLNQMEPVST